MKSYAWLNSTQRIATIFCLIASITNALVCCSVNNQQNESNSYRYKGSCNPLNCGLFDIQLQGGVDPIIWKDRGEFDTINPVGFINPVVKIFDIPKFRTFFHIPWIVGGQIGYALSDNVRIYAEFNYLQAKARDAISLVTTNTLVVPPQTVTFAITNYRLYNFYAGSRYYFNRWCRSISLFLGGKIGVIHHQRVNLNTLTIAAPELAPVNVIPTAPVPQLFKNNILISGGVNAGLDCCFYDHWSVVVTGEVVAQCGPKTNSNIALAMIEPISATNIIIGQIQTELCFPITVGIRYSF